MADTTSLLGETKSEFDKLSAVLTSIINDDQASTRSGVGASFCVWKDGEAIIDLSGGWSDKNKTIPWTSETLACVYSSGKAITAFLVAKAVSDGLLDYEKPISEVWPEFAQAGKENITLAQALSHQAGLPGFAHEVPPQIWVDWSATCDALAAMEPMWEPGTNQGYHAQTFGHLVGEPLHLVNNISVGTQIKETDVDVFCGLSPELAARTAMMVKPPAPPNLGDINLYTDVAFLKPWSAPAKVAREDWLAAEIPASNMHASAHGLAQMIHPLANRGRGDDGTEIINPSVIEAFYRERSHRDDLVLPFNLSWGAGMMRNINGHFGPNKNAMGHAGFGGSMVMVDPDHHLSMAFVMNRMSPELVGDPRTLALIDAVYSCL